jgi:homoserine dehydrogenase
VNLNSFQISGTSSTPCRIGILGFGTVGSAVARRLVRDDPGPPRRGLSAVGWSDLHRLRLTHICDRRAELKRGHWSELVDASRTVWTTCADDLLTSQVDVIVEAIGGIEPAAEWIRAALTAGKSVVTANKQVIAVHGPALLALAERQGRQLRFEAAVGGAMPIVRVIGDGLAGDCITRIVAILNGTTNAVLSRMEAIGCSFEAALAHAKQQGYAEPDPALDLDGVDARAKLAILCAQAFQLRVDPDQIATRSSRSITSADIDAARCAGGAIRQLAHAEYDRASRTLTAWVAPAIVPQGSLFQRTTGPRNAAVISGAYAGPIEIAGAGAGGDATAVALLSDIIAIARDRAAIVPVPVLSVPQVILGVPGSAGISNSECRILNSESSVPNSEVQIPNPEWPTSNSSYAEAV